MAVDLGSMIVDASGSRRSTKIVDDRIQITCRSIKLEYFCNKTEIFDVFRSSTIEKDRRRSNTNFLSLSAYYLCFGASNLPGQHITNYCMINFHSTIQWNIRKLSKFFTCWKCTLQFRMSTIDIIFDVIVDYCRKLCYRRFSTFSWTIITIVDDHVDVRRCS